MGRDGSIKEGKELHAGVIASEASTSVGNLHDGTRGIERCGSREGIVDEREVVWLVLNLVFIETP